jgi:hypothetical protein
MRIFNGLLLFGVEPSSHSEIQVVYTLMTLGQYCLQVRHVLCGVPDRYLGFVSEGFCSFSTLHYPQALPRQHYHVVSSNANGDTFFVMFGFLHMREN